MSSITATKRRHVNDANPNVPRSDWLSVFAAAAMFIGDDVTDEDAFSTLSGPDVGIKVGDGETAASFRVSDTTAVARILARLAERRALLGVRDRELERAGGDAARAGGDVDAADLDAVHHLVEALARLAADDVGILPAEPGSDTEATA